MNECYKLLIKCAINQTVIFSCSWEAVSESSSASGWFKLQSVSGFVDLFVWIFLEPLGNWKRNALRRCWDLTCRTVCVMNSAGTRMKECKMFGGGLQLMLVVVSWLLLSVTCSEAGEGCEHLFVFMLFIWVFSFRKACFIFKKCWYFSHFCRSWPKI